MITFCRRLRFGFERQKFRKLFQEFAVYLRRILCDHNVLGGSQNHPRSSSPMIAAVPFAAKAAVKRQMRAALT
jgi:hypothetical protein